MLAHISEHRALLATDTAGYSAGRPGVTEGSKMVIIPQLTCAIVHTGNLDLIAGLHQAAVARFSTFHDFAVETLNGRVIEDTFNLLEQLAARDRFVVEAGQAGAIVGWSEELGRPCGVAFERKKDGFRKFQCGYLVSPPLDGMPEDAATMLHMAAQQVAKYRPEVPGGAIGGRLLVAEVKRNDIHVKASPIPEPAQPRPGRRPRAGAARIRLSAGA